MKQYLISNYSNSPERNERETKLSPKPNPTTTYHTSLPSPTVISEQPRRNLPAQNPLVQEKVDISLEPNPLPLMA